MRDSWCHKLPAVWDDYQKGRLGPGKHSAILDHLAECNDCMEYSRLLKGAEALVADARIDSLLERRLTIATVERRLPEKPLPHRFGLAWILVPSTVAAALVIALLLSGDPEVRFGSSPVASERATVPEGITLDGTEPTLPQPLQVTSLDDRRQVIEVSPGTALWLDKNTSVQIESIHAGIARFRLNQGRAVAEVGVNQPGFRFVVVTSAGEFEARGTLFSVTVESQGVERVRVVEGLVEARSTIGQPFHLLGAGEELSLGDDAPRLAAREDLEQDRCLVLDCEPWIGASLTEIEQTAQTVKSARPDATVTSGRSAASDARRAIEEQRFDDAARLVEEVSRHGSDSSDTLALLTQLARAYRRAKLFGLAARTYERLIARFPDSDEGINGLVALAQIEQQALGNPTAALGHFQSYLDRRPQGYLAEAARAGRIRLLRRLGRFLELINEAGAYLEKHPNGFSRAEMLRQRGDGHARLGHVSVAVRDYRKVISLWPGTSEARRALAGLEALGVTP